jgi:ubiquinone/menaquinone biosynthesis C-methylase UbiE
MQVKDELRPQLHQMWASVAPAWREHADFVDRRSAVGTERMLDLVDPRPGERLLELACGPGGFGLAAARRVAPEGEVVLSDVAVEMIQIAAARARDLGLANTTTRALDLEQIEQPDESYDVVLCREGLMFTLDPARGAAEILRVLRRGGRCGIATWGARARNPWLGIVLDAASEQFGRPVPPPGIPGPFALDDREQVAALFAHAGFTAVEVHEVDVPMRAGSFDEWWTRTCALAGPLTNMLAALPAEAAGALRDRARAATRAYEVNGGLEFPAVTLFTTARRSA